MRRYRHAHHAITRHIFKPNLQRVKALIGGDKELVFQGVAAPAVDLDRHLQARFEVLNAGPERRPPMFYMAHVLHRQRHKQLALVIPRPVRRVLFPIIILLGSMLGD